MIELPLFTRYKEGKSAATYRRVWEGIQNDIFQYSELDQQLQTYCHRLSDLPGISGVLAIATDGHGELLQHHDHSLALLSDEVHFEELRSLRKFVGEAFSEEWFGLEDYEPHLYSRSLNHQNREYGVLVVRADDTPEQLPEAFAVIDSVLPQISSHICTELLRRENALCRSLQDLYVRNMTSTVPDVDEVVEELKRALGAASVTLLVKEHEKLYLSATTDDRLREQEIDYQEGEGFTGWVLQEEALIRLFDATDPEEIRKKTGIENRKQRPQAEAIALSGQPFHLLAVPIYSANPQSASTQERDISGPTNRCNGVLRLTRAEGPFTDYEKEILRSFGVLLGTALARAWKIYLSDCLWKGGTEAVAVTRYEPSKKRGQRSMPRLVTFDKAAKELFGRSEKELRGLNGEDLYAKGNYKIVKKEIRKILESGQDVLKPLNVKTQRPDGTVRSASASYRLIQSPFTRNRSRYTLSLFWDTTKQDKAAAQHKRLIELLTKRQLAYFAADAEGKTIETSPAEALLTGYSEEDLKRMNRVKLYFDRTHRQPLIKEVDRKRGLIHTTQELRHKSGKPFKADGFIRVREDDWGEGLVFEGLYEDATDKIELQRLLAIPTDRVRPNRELFEKIKEATNLNLDYMTSLSHQLRTPLNALIQNLYDFKRRLSDEDPLSKEMDYLIGQTRVANMLVSNLSYIDRILKGEQFTRREWSLAEMSIQTKLNFRNIVKDEKGLRIVVENEDISRIFDPFEGDNELFRQVLVNLIDNAFKYAAPKSEIRISASEGRYEQRFLDISDTGLPIPSGRTDTVFERGYRDPLAAAATDGSGLGLWIAKKIVELHGGTISCMSAPIPRSKWAKVTFRLTFPVNQVRERKEKEA